MKVILELLSVFFRAVLFRMGFVVKPYKICWLITWRCNLACNYCDIGQLDHQQMKKEELTPEEAKRIIPELKAMGVKFITFAGGEPLLYEGIYDVLLACKSEGFIVGLVTNGITIDMEAAKRLADAGVDHIHISLDVPGQGQNEIRNYGKCFERVDAAFKNLLKYRNICNYHLGVACVVSGYNSDKLEQVFEYAERMSLDSVALQPFFVNQIRTRDMAEKFSVPPQKVPSLRRDLAAIQKKYSRLVRNSPFYTRNVAEYFADNKLKGTTCYGGGLTINILPDGSLGPCYYLQDKQAGSLRDKRFTDIINSPSYRDMLKRVRKRDCPTCWCAVVHEYNILFRPVEALRALKLLRVAKTGR